MITYHVTQVDGPDAKVRAVRAYRDFLINTLNGIINFNQTLSTGATKSYGQRIAGRLEQLVALKSTLESMEISD